MYQCVKKTKIARNPVARVFPVGFVKEAEHSENSSCVKGCTSSCPQSLKGSHCEWFPVLPSRDSAAHHPHACFYFYACCPFHFVKRLGVSATTRAEALHHRC